ncbi:hypothetical protein ACIQGA_10095 [[Kitasatospora] papulosa]|uniref:hypothetical protein n=1 Tax=Streptomyces TaxID=1883 RepID=UPI000AC842C9|nr:hypothetical protein [[Kitasatospora] papulosa]
MVFKADGERAQGRRWMVIVTGGALGAEGFFRADLSSAEACVEAALEHLAKQQISPFT